MLNWIYNGSIKMSELNLIIFIGILESWHAFEELRFNISFSILSFEILLNVKYLLVLLLFFATIIGWFSYCSTDAVVRPSV